jgi:hypothetical protein
LRDGRKKKSEGSGSVEVGKINSYVASSVLFADKEMVR